MNRLKLVIHIFFLTGLSLVSTGTPVQLNGWRNTDQDKMKTHFRSASEIELKIVGRKDHHGACVQECRLAPNKKYQFSAEISAEDRNMVYLSVKLFKGGKEMERFTTKPNKFRQTDLLLEFQSGDADTAQLLLGVVLNSGNLGKKLSFRKITLKEKDRLEIVPGYENCSLYLNSCHSAAGEEFEGKVFYRMRGSHDWLPALDLVYIPQEKAARSSIVRLRENTEYELNVRLNDQGRKENLQAAFTTKKFTIPIGKTIVLNSTNFKGHLLIDSGGKPDGYLRYTAEKGFTLNGIPGKGEVIRIRNARYVILDGLVIRGNSNQNGIFVSESSDLQFLNCDIAGYSLVGTHQPERGGKYFDQKGRVLNYHSGIYLKNSRDILVERCYIHDPKASTNSWFYSHPAGPNAVMVDKVAGLVLRYNDFIGNDLTRWNDAVEGGGNGFPDGGPYRDAEIRGNYFSLTNDDGIELDGGQMNARMYDNKFENTFCGVSTAPCILGPSYIFDNLFTNPGDQFEQSNAAFKNNHKTCYGRIYFIGNTAAGKFIGITNFNGSDKNAVKAVFYNNLMALDRQIAYKNLFTDRLIFRRNLFWSSHAWLRKQLKEYMELPTVTKSLNDFREPLFVSQKSGNYKLREDSPGKQSAISVPNFQTVPNADLGAVRSFELPYRPLGFHTDQTELHFDRSKTSGTVTLSADPTFHGSFRIRKNFSADFLSVSPSSGTLKPGEKISLHVKILPEKLRVAKKHNTVFLIRSDMGFSRPVSVSFDNSDDPVLAKSLRRNIVYAHSVSEQKNGKCTLKFNVPRQGNYYVFVFIKDPPYAVNVSMDGKNHLKGKLYGKRYPGWHWLAIVPENMNQPNRPYSLTAGSEFRLFLSQRWNYTYKIKNAVLAATPEEMLYAPRLE